MILLVKLVTPWRWRATFGSSGPAASPGSGLVHFRSRVSPFIRRCGAEGRIAAFQAIDCGRNFRREGWSLPLQ